MKPSTHPEPPRQRGTSAHPATFASRIADRFARRTVAFPHVSRTHVPVARWVQILRHETRHLHLRPRVDLAVRVALRHVTGAPEAQAAGAHQAMPLALASAPSRVRRHDVVPRLVVRSERIVEPAPAVPRVVRVLAGAPTRPAAGPGHERIAPADGRLPATPGVSAVGRDPAATPPPTLDMRRITDDVIHAIDQRIVAARERMGRM